jgi:hypothetical protein
MRATWFGLWPRAERFGRVEQMPQAPSEPIEFPDNKGVARGEIRDRALEPGSRSQRPRRHLGE